MRCGCRYHCSLTRLRQQSVTRHGRIAAGKSVFLGCSALKRAYREELRVSPKVKIIYLKGTYALFAERFRHRHGHFAGEGILAGQFADLEEPADAITIDAAQSPQQIVAEIRKRLALSEDAPLAGAQL